MFKRRRAVNPKQEFIAQTSLDLAPNAGDRAIWVSPLLGSFALFQLPFDVDSKIFRPPYFELIAAGRVEEETQEFPEYHYFYDGSGKIFGVSHLYTPFRGRDKDSEQKALSEIDFQLENGLTFPNEQDYNNVELYLKNGKMDKV